MICLRPSAFSYYAVFGGGAVLPTIPPLMAAENGPKKIVPNYGDARPSNSSQTSSSEKFVSRWPTDNQEPPETASKTSMVSAGSSEKFVARWPRDNQEPPETAQIRPAVPIALAASAPPPVGAAPALTAPFLPPPAVPAPHSSEPKKIHTVIIRSDGSEQTATSAAAAAHSATSTKAQALELNTIWPCGDSGPFRQELVEHRQIYDEERRITGLPPTRRSSETSPPLRSANPIR
jgi:hypothetical protein